MANGKKEKKISGRDRAYTYIRNVILSDPATAGTFLSEQDVADQVGVSRTPVREAFLRLATENLLQLVPNRGALVLATGPQEIRQVLQAREMIEVWSARHALSNYSSVAKAMAARLQAQKELAADASFEEFIELDRLFHLELIKFSGNPVLSQMYDVLQARHFTLGVRAMRREEMRREHVLIEHEAIVEAFAAGDADRVEKAIKAHLDSTYQSLVLPR
ncbi:GntR family transcriptional regulator [uncultured Agrobacterium sp.]|uniref:GntR family transcriptional regulator n=1 Tax=uncultured Agrobacterium sp. TaxID=157277 RepID=UPI00258EF599|nr:GntR family transcriptional regulator [uncultured Agrobacterium sp.]